MLAYDRSKHFPQRLVVEEYGWGIAACPRYIYPLVMDVVSPYLLVSLSLHMGYHDDLSQVYSCVRKP